LSVVELPRERRRRDLRASHADRERAVDFIRQHAGEGRLTTEELSDRVGSALSAKTLGELDDLVVDLPAEPFAFPTAPVPPPPPRRSYLASAAVRYAVTMLLLLNLAAVGFAHVRGAVIGFWLVLFVVLRFARRADRRRRYEARARARGAYFPPPPVEPTSWQPPRVEGRD
jgi:hypothetical protein